MRNCTQMYIMLIGFTVSPHNCCFADMLMHIRYDPAHAKAVVILPKHGKVLEHMYMGVSEN